MSYLHYLVPIDLNDSAHKIDWQQYTSEQLDKFVMVIENMYKIELFDILSSKAPNR